MKTLKLFLAMTVVALTVASCGSKKQEQKYLVLYYSQTGVTKAVAEEIASRLGADIEEIQCVTPYDSSFQSTIARCMQEREEGLFPEIKPVAADLSKYDVIFIGYPIWFGTYALPMETYLSQVDLSGKKVVPFCTFGSGGLESSVADLAECQPNAEILPGFGIRALRMDYMKKEVEKFLIANGFIEGEYTAPAEFPEQHEVTPEEAAIFDSAVADYRMIQAKPVTVASRSVEGGTEYLFHAADQPKDEVVSELKDKVNIPENRKMEIYVIVPDGQKPDFTRVVRD